MTYEDALKLAENEFFRFQGLFYTKASENPDLTFEEINDLVEYEHPTFDNDDDQGLYDDAAMVVALGHVLSNI